MSRGLRQVRRCVGDALHPDHLRHRRDVLTDAAGDPANGGALFAIGILAGLALMLSGIWQGRAVASCIAAAKDKPEIFGLSLAPAAIVEGYAVFTFVFALVLAGSIPHVGA